MSEDKKGIRMHIWIDTDLKVALERLAKAQDRTLGYYIRTICTEHINKVEEGG